MSSLITKRIVAIAIDYMFVALYAVLLFVVAVTFFETNDVGPINGQIIGFLSLTLPVFLYFYLSEKSKRRATLGKKILKISVDSHQNKNIFYRNVLKFLPWEIAHIGMHWMYYFSNQEAKEPIWVWIVLLLPQIVVIIYIVSLFLNKGSATIYDKIAKTKIINKN